VAQRRAGGKRGALKRGIADRGDEATRASVNAYLAGGRVRQSPSGASYPSGAESATVPERDPWALLVGGDSTESVRSE
jgi:hypothetical protein